MLLSGLLETKPASALTTWTLAALLLLGAATFWARCTAWRSVFPPTGEVELVPTDSHFYVRFARLQLHAFPKLTSHDPYINHPEGAQLYVPLPHGVLVAAFIALAGEAQAERAAAWVGPVVGTLEWLGVTLLGLWVLGRGRGLLLAALLAFAPAVIESAALGNADHHVHEPMFTALLLLGMGGVARAPGRAWGVGAALGLARWLTPTGFLLIPLSAIALGLNPLFSRDRTGARGVFDAGWRVGAGAALVLAPGSLLFGRPLSLAYEQFSAFHVLLAVASFGAVCAVAAWRGARRRVALGAVGLTVVAAAPLLAEVLRAASHMGRADPLLSLVFESEPLWRDPRWALELFGPLLFLTPLAVVGLVRNARQERALSLAALAFLLPLLAIAALQARFSPMAAAAASLACAVGLPALLPLAGPVRFAVAGVLAVVSLPLAFALSPRPFEPAPRDLLLARPTLRWMRDHLPPASLDPFGQTRPSYGVISTHLLGHVVPLWAERPTVATMLSQDPSFVAANLRAARVLAAETDAEAFEAARATGARYLLVTPTDRLLGVGAPSERSLLFHLLDHAGMQSPVREASAHFRWIHDSAEQRLREEGGSAARVFEVVPGATLQGAATPGAEVTARLQLTTPGGVVLAYLRTVRADPSGAFALAVAHPGEYALAADGAALALRVSEEAVRAGHTVVVPDGSFGPR